MDRNTLETLASAARERYGAVTGDTLRQEALDGGIAAELLSEQATTLGRLGSRLEVATTQLTAIREAAAGSPTAAHREADSAAREALRELRWEMQVVREAMGLRHVRADIDRFWPMPPKLG